MSLLISDDCTSCDACRPLCPNDAISEGDIIFLIDAARCTECVGAHDKPQCVDVCPADAIQMGVKEDQTVLQARYHALHG